MRDMFSTVAPRYDFITRTFSYGMDRRWKRDCVAGVDLPERPVVLDLASGTGDFSLMIRQRYPGAQTVAVDLTERMLQLAQERGVRHTVCGDAGKLPFPDASFDVVVANHVISTAPNPEAVLDECARMLRPGGELILVSRIGADAGLRHLIELLLQPIVRRLGWRSEFPWTRFARWTERRTDVRLIERRPTPPFGHFSLLRFVKCAHGSGV